MSSVAPGVSSNPPWLSVPFGGVSWPGTESLIVGVVELVPDGGGTVAVDVALLPTVDDGVAPLPLVLPIVEEPAGPVPLPVELTEASEFTPSIPAFGSCSSSPAQLAPQKNHSASEGSARHDVALDTWKRLLRKRMDLDISVPRVLAEFITVLLRSSRGPNEGEVTLRAPTGLQDVITTARTGTISVLNANAPTENRTRRRSPASCATHYSCSIRPG